MELERHFDHDIVIAKYSGLDGEPVNYSVECETCYEVIIDDEAYSQFVSPPFQVAEFCADFCCLVKCRWLPL